MSYQPSMFSFEIMQDRSATKSGHLRLPKGMTRGECKPMADSRARGEQSCPFLSCRHHLVPELVKLRPKGAVKAMARRLSGDIKHTCALDLADEGPQDEFAIGDALGIDRQAVPQRTAEAMHRFGKAMQDEVMRVGTIERVRYDLTCGKGRGAEWRRGGD